MRNQVNAIPLLRLLLLCVGLTIGHLGCGGSSASTPPPPPAAPVSVTVSPASASVPASGTQQFTASVTGTSNTAVTWSLSRCTGADCGTISPAGLYAAPSVIPTQATVTVTATSQADRTKFSTAAVNDMPIEVSIAPAGASVAPDAALAFSASVRYDPKNAGVVWALPAGCSSATCGALSNATANSVTYTGPATAPNPPTVTLTATSVTDPSKLAAITITVSAQTLTTLYNFGSQPNDGANPYAGLIRATDGNLFGTTALGGTGNVGTVFKVTPGGTLTTLLSFPADGRYPYAGLVQGSDGNLYGTTKLGADIWQCYGLCGGTVFKITPGGTLTTQYSFCRDLCTTGSNPYAGLIQATDGNFYGTTSWGGNPLAFLGGTVFKITPAGALTRLYTFCSQPNCADGTTPYAGLVQAADGNFLGTTQEGGLFNGNCSTLGCGTVFKITPEGMLTTLYQFCSRPNCADGEGPDAGLIQAADGDFYGTTSLGGTNGQGTVFRITSGGTLTTLHSFSGWDGSQPYAGLIQSSDGNLYGTTGQGGGLGCGGSGCGTVFKVTPGGTLTTLYSFSGKDGGTPAAALIEPTPGNFYGTTSAGGANNKGTVFRLSM